MKLSRIDWLKECGHFRNYEWDSSLPEFKQVNVIYGANGTGKSSFSSAFEELKGGEESSFKKVSLTFADSEGSQTATTTDGKYSEIFERIMVYGDRFIEKGHRFKQDPELEAVLTIGARSVEQEERLQEIEKILSEAEEERDRYEAEEKRANEAIKDIYTRVSRSVVDSIAAAGGRWRSRNSYNSKKVQQAYDSRSSEWSSLAEGKLKEIISLINSPKQEALQGRNLRVNVPSDLIDRLKKCLKSTPISTVLDTLEYQPEASSWVQQGIPIHKELDHCIFCAGALSDERKRAIEEHFSDAVEELQKEIRSIIKELTSIEEACSDKVRSLFDKGLLFADLRNSYVTEKTNLEDQYERLENSAKKIRLVANEKLQNVLLPVNDEITALPSLDVAPVEKFYAAHNDRVVNHTKRIEPYARMVEEHFLKESLDNFLTEENAREQASVKLKKANLSVKALQEERMALVNTEGDPIPAAETLNLEVSRILGRDELHFEVTEDGKHYQITRNGVPAKGLSTGERSVIMLVYFMETVARQTNSEKPIVIIDDPISSLDSDVFMGISAYIWSEVINKKHAEQLILLTHNFELFRQWDIQLEGAKRFIEHSLYEIRSVHAPDRNGGCLRSPQLVKWPPTKNSRKKVRSSYHHAFWSIYQAKLQLENNDSLDTRLDAQLLFPNVIRRLLESFLAFKIPDHVGDFTGSMRQAGQMLAGSGYQGDADALRLRLTRYTHAHSHNESPASDLIISPDEVQTAIAAVFTFINAIDSVHFSGICSVLDIDENKLLHGF